MNYYNDNDPGACAWIRELIADGLLPAGEVDSRNILEVTAGDLQGFAQCHFFAGIGGWSRALQLAGWPENEPVWTGSCPCQPLSCAGKRIGHVDERHLWPAFYDLIAECRPPVVFGEQVAGKDGREWLAGVRADLEGAGYACGAADLCAASCGAPHIRQRLYWVGDSDEPRPQGRRQCRRNTRELSSGADGASSFWANSILIACRDGKARRTEPSIFPLADGVPGGRVGLLRGAGNAISPPVAAQFIAAWRALKTGG